MKKAFRVFDTAITWIEDIGCTAIYAAIVCIVTVHVFFRYVLFSGLLWSDELIQILLVYMVMFGSARAIRTNGHTELNSFANRLPEKPRYLLRTLIALACVAFFALFFVGAVEHTMNAGRLRTVILRIPRAYCYLSMPIGAGLMLYEFIKTIKHRITHDPREDELVVECDVPEEAIQ
ncbi:MAG: TRAP transporter small permease [Planctomycetaceae bacterium]|nr:TRAP transporter small permease [Planctomycetaceae bacterium]